MSPTKHARWFSLFLILVSLLISSMASGAVRREGVWPASDQPVTLHAEGIARAEAVKRLAKEAGWSVVLHAPKGDPVDLHVDDQPADKVLEMLLSDHDYVAKRDGTLISIVRSTPPPDGSAATDATEPSVPIVASPVPKPLVAPAVPAPPKPPLPPSPVAGHKAGKSKGDRIITGGSIRIEKGETVDDVVIFGGSVDVYGTAKGDVVVMGGSARIFKDAHVHGDATAIGGSLSVEDGARVDGDVGVIGGVLKRGKKAEIGGTVTADGVEGSDEDGFALRVDDEGNGKKAWSLGGLVSDLGSAITHGALLFVFGALFLALATRRMETLEVEVASRPMRTLALGVVGILTSVVVVVALCVTVIGIPVAVVAVLLGIIFAYVGICAVLTTLGGALLRHRTKNPYVHLALGCVLFLLVGAIPYVGGAATAVLVLMGLGSLVATRGAGLVVAKPRAAPAV